jgi:hypothetical protein
MAGAPDNGALCVASFVFSAFCSPDLSLKIRKNISVSSEHRGKAQTGLRTLT